MRSKIFLVLATLFCAPIFAQTLSIKEVDSPPRLENKCIYDNNEDCLLSSIAKFVHLNLDIRNLEKGGVGSAYVQFVIDEIGQVTNIQVRSNSKKLEEEAKKVIQKLPFTEPAMKNGEPVSMLYVYPVKFRQKTFNGYEEFLSSDLAPLDFATLSDVAKAPQIKNYPPGKDVTLEGFKNDLADKLTEMNFSKDEINELKITFVITKNSIIDHLMVISSSKRLRKAATILLENTEIETPAFNDHGEPTSIRITYLFNTI